ncbi:hypothetical protein ACN4EK_17110 [Pantanalinema rosaneae CENA516]|uniref:hypothetical protein n=1 Tax=Pantanalinema rosaneae TaxID=1620701 RepID=UPI003D6EFA24
MGNSAQLSVVSRPDLLANSFPMTSLPPFDFATVRQTVLKLGQDIVLTHHLRVPTGSTSAIAAMRQLVEVMQQLRSPEGGWNQDQMPTPAALAPYVSEEAYEVLDALPGKAAAKKSPRGKSASRQVNKAELPLGGLVVMESLIPYLLWCVARTSYSLMQMMEGMPVRLRQGRSWSPGILRLVVLLDVKATDLEWCFDLATGCPAGILLSGNPIIQSDANLPLYGINTVPNQRRSRQKAGWVERQLQELADHLQLTSPMIAPLLAGIAVDLLPPGQEWRSGNLNLALGLEFTPQNLDSSWQRWSTPACDLVEGELLEAVVSQSALTHTTNVHPVPVAVVDLPEQSLATTIVRLANPKHLDRYTNLATQAQLAAAIARLQTTVKPEPEQRLLQVVQEAYGLAETARTSISLLQPDLLMDQLLPKLLWQLTAGTYEVMQLIGGLEARLLQPGDPWRDGTLRLIAVLHLTGAGITWQVDLATGRLVAGGEFKLASEAIVQSHRLSACQYPMQVKDLTAHLQQQIRETAPEVGFLMTKTAIDYLTTAQEWRSGFLYLDFYLEFLPRISHSFADSPVQPVLLHP